MPLTVLPSGPSGTEPADTENTEQQQGKQAMEILCVLHDNLCLQLAQLFLTTFFTRVYVFILSFSFGADGRINFICCIFLYERYYTNQVHFMIVFIIIVIVLLTIYLYMYML